jgi:hypothetical protein
MGNIFEEASQTQSLALQLGKAIMGNHVVGWATKHAMVIPSGALSELMDIIAPKKHLAVVGTESATGNPPNAGKDHSTPQGAV